jgi:hypothetical protein
MHVRFKKKKQKKAMLANLTKKKGSKPIEVAQILTKKTILISMQPISIKKFSKQKMLLWFISQLLLVKLISNQSTKNSKDSKENSKELLKSSSSEWMPPVKKKASLPSKRHTKSTLSTPESLSFVSTQIKSKVT